MIIDKADIAECLLHHLFLEIRWIDPVSEAFGDLNRIVHIFFIEHIKQQNK